MNNKWLNYVGLVLVAVIWGANFGISRLAMESFNPIVFSVLRFGIAIPFFFLILKWTEGSVGIPWRIVPRLALIGLLGITVLEITVMYSIKFTTLANASLLNVAPWPIFAALFAPLFMRESITLRLIVGGAISLVGVSLVILGGSEGFSLTSDNMLGNAMAFGVSIIGALFNLSSMSLMKQYSALRVSTWTITFGLLFMLPLTIGGWSQTDWSALQAGQYLSIGYNVLICTVLAFVVWNTCMFRVGATRSNFFRYAVPAAAVIAGYFMFDEKIALLQMCGAACMAAGLIWISIERKRPAPIAISNKTV
ncbi:drug/metabolite transporter (DMT)-like permease [Paenibacillus castaneae]|uniref:DMT family transporter n=1 Tax=Paenibacillus castaneae TaxID=474957 RepID=UPI000C9BCE06|nr:DMT family transporter [Paenibacillus castaneae]NIK78193.1 drug/metabolite transporter (DMT)-like permease [Paenibacillus castaneae]